METLKLCKTCGEEKPVSGFSRRSKSNDGLSVKCKACTKEYDKEYRKLNFEQVKKRNAEWIEKNKEHYKEIRKAYWSNRRKNSEKQRLYDISYREKNKEKMKVVVAIWASKNRESKIRSEHKRRVAKRCGTGVISKGIIEKLKLLQKGKCVCCGQPLGEDFQLDHIMPLALGGSNSDENLQLLKGLCNRQKRAKHPIDFMQQRGFLL